ncbi:T9SS type A sorting domain-containing protein, partial [Hymenobacter persicinus]
QGNVLWARRTGGVNYDRGTALAVDAATGSVAVAGAADYTFDINSSQSSIYVARYSDQGVLAWERKITPTEPDLYSGYGVAFDNRGGLYMTGDFQGNVTFGPTTLTAAEQDMYAVRFDSRGNAVWADRVGGSNTNFGAAIGLAVNTDPSGNAYFAGAVLGTVNFGSIVSQGNSVDMFVAKLNAGGTLTAARGAVAELPLSVYPNPAAGRATLVLPAGGGRLVLSDVLGRPVREQALPAVAGPCPVELTGLTPGLYLLRATLGNGQTASARLTVR